VACNSKTGEIRQILDEESEGTVRPRCTPARTARCMGSRARSGFAFSRGKEKRSTGRHVLRGRRRRHRLGLSRRFLSRWPPRGRLRPAKHRLAIRDPKTGEVKTVPVDYEAGGVSITSLAEGPEDAVYASTAHPMHLLKLSTKAGKLEDLGPIPRVAGEFLRHRFLGQRGVRRRLLARRTLGLRCDAAVESRLAAERPGTRVCVEWHRDLCRPRTTLVHPERSTCSLLGLRVTGWSAAASGS